MLNKDKDWYKKENELVHVIQRKAKELSFPEQHTHLELTINNYKKLYERRISIKDMHGYFGITSGKFYRWRKENGLIYSIEKQQKPNVQRGIINDSFY